MHFSLRCQSCFKQTSDKNMVETVSPSGHYIDLTPNSPNFHIRERIDFTKEKYCQDLGSEKVNTRYVSQLLTFTTCGHVVLFAT